VTELDEWNVQPLNEVGLLLLLQEVWGKSRHDEVAFRQSVEDLNARDYDELSYAQFEAVLVQVAAQTFVRPFGNHSDGDSRQFFTVSDKVMGLLDYLEVPFDMQPLSRAQSPTGSRRDTTQSPQSRLSTPGGARGSGKGRHFGNAISPLDASWMQNPSRPGTSTSVASRDTCMSTGARSTQKSFIVSRPRTSNRERPGTAESSNTTEYWQKVLGGTLRPQSRGADSLSPSISVGRPETADLTVKRARQTGYGDKGIAKQWIREAIRIINPSDATWRLTMESIETFLIKKMKVTPESCDILKPGMLNDMFAETDLDKDGTVSLEELSLSVSARFKRRYHADRWKTLIRMANQ
jgi:hypothetical protein